MTERRSKYNAVRTQVDGITFDSKAEARRYQELRLLEQAGEIHNLRRQVAFRCVVNGQDICTYRADFEYILPDGRTITEDVKGRVTPVYRLKKKLVAALFGVQITEVEAR